MTLKCLRAFKEPHTHADERLMQHSAKTESNGPENSQQGERVHKVKIRTIYGISRETNSCKQIYRLFTAHRCKMQHEFWVMLLA